MVRLWHIAAWPLVVKVPVLVAGLMVTVAVATSQVPLWRFAKDQSQVVPWRVLTQLTGPAGGSVIVELPNGMILALPGFPVQSADVLRRPQWLQHPLQYDIQDVGRAPLANAAN
jgi:hypothetical protein